MPPYLTVLDKMERQYRDKGVQFVAVNVGPDDTVLEMAAQAMLGAARMVLETREHPAKLKDVVTTPAGTTIDGLLELESGGRRVTLIKTVLRATKRAAELLHE